MSILHYTIGLPPTRRGGSLQYANDLILEQSRQGHDVLVLKCGDTLFRSKKTRIKKSKSIHKIPTFKLTNPLTPTLIYGTSDPTSQHREIDIDYKNIKNFIQRNKITILHLHTLMGLHSDVVKIFKEKGVKIVYTTHDFHGICPHYNLINFERRICDSASGKSCAFCNMNEPTDLFLRIVNSSLYQKLKRYFNSPKKKVLKKKIQKRSIEIENQYEKYDQLLDYYRNYFTLIDKYHFNSEQTKKVFKSFIPFAEGEVISVITNGISDKRCKLNIESIIKLGFIGSLNEYKGFQILKECLLELEKEGFKNYKLFVYCGEEGKDEDIERIEYMPPYKYEELSNILYHLEGVIVPSKCYETFSLVTLESIAHGRPTIVSDHVGAKDIVRSYFPDFIFSTKEDLKTILKKILSNPNLLNEFNAAILKAEWKYGIETHTNKIIELYQK